MSPLALSPNRSKTCTVRGLGHLAHVAPRDHKPTHVGEAQCISKTVRGWGLSSAPQEHRRL